LGTSPLLLHTVPKPVQALLTAYDEIFHVLAVEDLLLPKPILDLGFDGVVRWKSLASEMSFQFPKHK
jgi:hypothetical protein